MIHPKLLLPSAKKVNSKSKAEHRETVRKEIIKQNIYERKWKIKSNLEKFKMIMLGNIPKQSIFIENVKLDYSKKS